MAKRKKKRNKRKTDKDNSLQSLSPQMVMEKGDLLLKQGKFQDAVACFKQLLTLEQRPEFFSRLEKAYLGRISALSAKSMYKEAMALLKTLAHRCPDAQIDPQRLTLLLQTEKYKEAVRFYGHCHDQLEKPQRRRIEALFGMILLSDYGAFPDDFEAESLLAKVYPKAIAAIDIFCNGQSEHLEEALRQIPVRSPYRDLRILLHGLYYYPRDRAKARNVLQKIGEDSPYYSCAAGYCLESGSGRSLIEEIASTARADRTRLQRRYGVPSAHFKLLERLAQSNLSGLQLYQLVKRHERCFDTAQRVALYRNIIPFCHDRAPSIVRRSALFGTAEKYRLCALAAERDDQIEYAVSYWGEYLSTIDHNDRTKHKEIAMVIRRQAVVMRRDHYFYSSEEILDTMLKSLEYDVDHVQTWLGASAYAKRYLGFQQYYRIIQDAVRKLPEEVPLLLAAMRACGDRGAFKKAAGFAEKVLVLDPINTAALDFLVASRLEHGRKLASQKKWALAEKQIRAADTTVRSIRLKGRQQICLGMLLLLQNQGSALQCIDEGRRQCPYPLLGHLLVALEARLYDLPKAQQRKFDKLLTGHAKSCQTVDPVEFQCLISWILGFENRHWPMLKEACQKLNNYFAKGATVELNPEEGLSLCRALEQIDQLMALIKCSKALSKKYPDVPQFTMWYLMATGWKNKTRYSFSLFIELERIVEELEEKQQFEFIDYISRINNERGGTESSLYDYEDVLDVLEEDEDSIDFGPFGAPKVMGETNQRQKPSPSDKPPIKQLSLFDDD